MKHIWLSGLMVGFLVMASQSYGQGSGLLDARRPIMIVNQVELLEQQRAQEENTNQVQVANDSGLSREVSTDVMDGVEDLNAIIDSDASFLSKAEAALALYQELSRRGLLQDVLDAAKRVNDQQIAENVENALQGNDSAYEEVQEASDRQSTLNDFNTLSRADSGNLNNFSTEDKQAIVDLLEENGITNEEAAGVLQNVSAEQIGQLEQSILRDVVFAELAISGVALKTLNEIAQNNSFEDLSDEALRDALAYLHSSDASYNDAALLLNTDVDAIRDAHAKLSSLRENLMSAYDISSDLSSQIEAKATTRSLAVEDRDIFNALNGISDNIASMIVNLTEDEFTSLRLELMQIVLSSYGLDAELEAVFVTLVEGEAGFASLDAETKQRITAAFAEKAVSEVDAAILLAMPLAEYQQVVASI